jgi:hypothetical protein
VGTLQRRWRICLLASRVSRLGQSICEDLGAQDILRSPISDRRYVCGFAPQSRFNWFPFLAFLGSPSPAPRMRVELSNRVGMAPRGTQAPILLRTLFDALGNLVLRH